MDALPDDPSELSRGAQLRQLHAEHEAYRDDLPPPPPDWPMDGRAVMAYLQEHLFETDLTAAQAKQACGAYDHSISTRFACYAGTGIKAYILTHQIALAKRLLRYDKLKIVKVALAVGYDSPSAFTMAFRRYEGCTPSTYRKILRNS